MICFKCTGQEIAIERSDVIAENFINANVVKFSFCERWSGMVKTAQFTQRRGDEFVTYNVLIDELTGTAAMPNDVIAGDLMVSAFGYDPDTGVRITSTISVVKVMPSGFVGDGETPIPPTPDLYAQLIARVNAASGVPYIGDNGNWYVDGIDTGVKAGSIEDSAPPIVTEAAGNVIAVSDSTDMPLRGLTVYGKTTQDGTPSIDAPVEMHSVVDAGEVTLTIGEASGSDDTADDTQTATISTAEGLRGVPVRSGAGTYTDTDGQRWIADTVEYDAETGVAQYIKRTGTKTLDETAAWKKSSNENVDRYYTYLSDYDASMMPYMLCSIGTVKTTNPSEISVGFVGIDNYKNLSINYAAAGTTTLDDFLAYIAENPITVVYPIASPIETVIDAGDVCALRSRYPATTIYNDAGAWMRAEYVADTKAYIDQKIASIAAAMIAGI